jgi:hypothetical protein
MVTAPVPRADAPTAEKLADARLALANLLEGNGDGWLVDEARAKLASLEAGAPPEAGDTFRLSLDERISAAIDHVIALDAWQPVAPWTDADKRLALGEAEADYELLEDQREGWPRCLVTPDVDRALDQDSASAAGAVIAAFRGHGITSDMAIFSHVQTIRPDATRARWDALVGEAAS